MDAKSRRKLEMGKRALDFSRAHPDGCPGYTAAVTRLEEGLARAKQLADQQRQGTLEVRAATARKLELRRTMKQAHLSHLGEVAKVAAREVPELAQKLVLRPGVSTYLAFRTAARGLVESVLDSLLQTLDQFDAAVDRESAGGQAHVTARAELRATADEIVQIVRVMDRYRFMADPALLAGWASASNVVASPRSEVPGSEPEVTPPAGGEVRPAA
jgi:hypothetical protein